MEEVSAVLTARPPASMVGVAWEVSRSMFSKLQLPADAGNLGYSVREELPLPDKPPFTVHLGNLSFDATVGDVTDFFAGCECTNVRIIEDKMEMKPKGFGYAEFATLNGLKQALTLNGTQFQGRNIRISVADPRKFGSHIFYV
jgi:RNA recognition motif-containing protein